MMATKTFWQDLITKAIQTEENELDCDGCFELLDQYVDILDEGGDPSDLMPQIQQHMQICHCCHTELEALLIALELAVDPTDSDAPVSES